MEKINTTVILNLLGIHTHIYILNFVVISIAVVGCIQKHPLFPAVAYLVRICAPKKTAHPSMSQCDPWFSCVENFLEDERACLKF